MIPVTKANCELDTLADNILAAEASEVSPTLIQPSVTHDHKVKIFVVHELSPVFQELQVASGTTVSHVIQAENDLRRMKVFESASTLLGMPLSNTHVVQEHTWIRLNLTGDLPETNHMTRLQHLYAQGAWVASDELAYYLADRPFGDQVFLHGVICFDASVPMSQQLKTIINILQKGQVHTFAVLSMNHWTPFVLDFEDNCVKIATTDDGFVMLNKMSQEYEYALLIDVEVRDTPNGFRR